MQGMETKPKPMDPAYLSAARLCARSWAGELEDGFLVEGPEWDVELVVDALRAVIADRDRLEAEVALLRSRCPVLPKDITEAGMTGDKLRAWLTLNGWAESQSCWGSNHGDVTTWRPIVPDGTGICIYEIDDAHLLTSAVNSVAYYFRRDAWSILHGIAAMEVSP